MARKYINACNFIYSIAWLEWRLMNSETDNEQIIETINLRKFYFQKTANELQERLDLYKSRSIIYKNQSKIVLNKSKMARLSPDHTKHENNIHMVNSFAMIGWPDLSIKGDKITK